MKPLLLILGLLVCTFSAPTESGFKAQEAQIETVIEWLIIAPLLRSGDKGNGDIDVVIVDDQAARNSMIELYAGYKEWVSFLSEGVLIQREDLYIDPKSGREANVSRFEVIHEESDKCLVRWRRFRSKIAGFEKIVELRRVKGKWLIFKIETKYVS